MLTLALHVLVVVILLAIAICLKLVHSTISLDPGPSQRDSTWQGCLHGAAFTFVAGGLEHEYPNHTGTIHDHLFS